MASFSNSSLSIFIEYFSYIFYALNIYYPTFQLKYVNLSKLSPKNNNGSILNPENGLNQFKLFGIIGLLVSVLKNTNGFKSI